MTQQEFLSRRQTLLAQMQPGSAALIFAAPEAVRSADSEYPYRQNSDFWYFTGFNEPEALLVLIKSDETHNHSVLFNRVRDLTAEIWFGRRLGRGGRAGEAWRRPGAGVQRNQPAAVSAAQRSGRDLLRPG
ncbi:aminopeptidase P N-terminal domain-containing protein [Klebsiella pneumoniae]